jgi:hypothetical protein
MLLSERLYSAAQIFLQYTMDTVICQDKIIIPAYKDMDPSIKDAVLQEYY